MVVLKKIKASTLMETLVATVLIVVIFMLASMILNNLFSNSIKNNTKMIDAQLNELQYLYKNDNLILPFFDDFKSWEVSVESSKNTSQNIITFQAINSETNKAVLKEIIAN